MFEPIINYIGSDQFKPNLSITAQELADYLIKKGKSKRIKERMLTQFWQLDDAPLESKLYSKESEQWLREE